MRKPIKISGPKKAKKPVAPRVPRTRNLQTETQSQHMGKIRSALRDISRWWKPIKAARDRARLGKGKNAVYRCEECFKLVEKIEIDHIFEAGSLKDYNDLPGFCERLFVEDPQLLKALCTTCHNQKTHG